MPAHLRALDSESLARLRALVKAMHAADGRAVPMQELVALARDVEIDAGLTIDFEASREIGQPMLVVRVGPTSNPAACLDGLSRREKEVAGLVAEGLSNKQIARRLFIALPTVKDHVHQILTKTGLSNRSQSRPLGLTAYPRCET